MRLINTTTWKLQHFDLPRAPGYAILSHVWDKAEEEVTFMDMRNLEVLACTQPPKSYPTSSWHPQKKGFIKIQKTCELAKSRGIDWVWIDTCCIDRTSSAELDQSINEMFRYYAQSRVCFVYLADSYSGSLKSCRWFSRGWTLQEFIASSSLYFHDRHWRQIGSKTDPSFRRKLASITNIPDSILTGPWRGRYGLRQSTATIMSWASGRETRLPEDKAYCLLGLFDISMTPNYGEGLEKAFQRLQIAIPMKHNDLTILAWNPSTSHCKPIGCCMQLLAPNPAAFSGSGRISPFSSDLPQISITSNGLSISQDIPLSLVKGDNESICMCIGTRNTREGLRHISIPLRKIGPRQYCRHPRLPMRQDLDNGSARVNNSSSWQQNSMSYEIFLDSTKATQSVLRAFREHAIHVPRQFFKLLHVAPERLWDPEDQLFMRPQKHHQHFFPNVLIMAFSVGSSSGEVIVVCDNRSGTPQVGTVRSAPDVAVFLRQGHYRELSASCEYFLKRFRVEWFPQAEIRENALGHDIILRSGPHGYFPHLRARGAVPSYAVPSYERRRFTVDEDNESDAEENDDGESDSDEYDDEDEVSEDESDNDSDDD